MKRINQPKFWLGIVNLLGFFLFLFAFYLKFFEKVIIWDLEPNSLLLTTVVPFILLASGWSLIIIVDETESQENEKTWRARHLYR